MKKFLISLFSICLCAVCAFSFVGCGAPKIGGATSETTNVNDNIGTSLVYNNELYFVNGYNTNSKEANGGTIGSVYKVGLTQTGALNGNYTKVVDNLVGYTNGGIAIMGNNLYYATPSVAKNSRGETLYNKTRFMRKNLDNGAEQEIYSTELNDESETVSFGYYKVNNGIVLVVYEKTNKTLISLTVGEEIKTNFRKTDIASAVISTALVEENANNADNFVYYTMNPLDNAVNTSTTRLYRVNPNGENEILLCDDANLSIAGIYGGKLILSASFGTSPNNFTHIYAYPMTHETQAHSVKIVEQNNSKSENPAAIKYLISNLSKDNIVYVTDGDGIAVIYVDSSTLVYKKYNGNLDQAEKEYTISLIDNVPSKFLCTYVAEDGNTYLMYYATSSSKNIVYKIRVNFADQDEVDSEKPEPTQLSTTSIKEANGNMVAKMVGNYLYVFASDEDDNSMMYRINFNTPKEINDAKDPADRETDETKLKVGAAELVGGAKI